MKKNLDRIIYYLILSIIVLLPFLKLTSYNLYLLNIIEDSFKFNHVYFLWISLIPLIFIYVYGIITKKFKINYIDYMFYILILYALISTIFAVNIKLSIVGEFHRNEGLLSILTYYFILLCSKNIDNKKYTENIINTILIIGLFQSFYSIFQVYTNFSFIRHYTDSYMAHGLCGNPNFLGSYMVMLLCISVSKFLLEKKYRYIIISIIYFVTLVLAASSGPFVTFIIMLIFITIKNYKYTSIKYILLLLTFIPVLFISDYLINATHKNQVVENYNIVSDITNVQERSANEITSGRISLWKNSLPLVKKYYLVGAGLDNFGEVYEYNTNELRYDKAHNVYLQILITNGLIPLLVILTICLLVFIKGLKLNDFLYLPIYFSCIGYMIQAFANISVIDVAPTFFILLGLFLNKNTDKSI